jgi:hypothetical protein
MASQNKATMRKKLRSALAHKKAADTLLDSILSTQSKWNSAMDKLQADSPVALDVNYLTTQGITPLYEADGVNLGSQHKASLRATMRSALAHRKLADELCDALEEFQTAHNALMAKLDAEAGTLASVDFLSSLGVQVLDADAEGSEAQHKASLRKSLRSALADKELADSIMDALSGLQAALNSELALLDTSVVTGSSGNKVSVIDPD